MKISRGISLLSRTGDYVSQNAGLRVFLFLFLIIVMACYAIRPAGAQEKLSPYGNYRNGTDSSRYGEKRPVTTAEEARKRLGEYFSKKNVTIGEIEEKELFFEAVILDADKKPVDRVIIDKRTGRIRSTY